MPTTLYVGNLPWKTSEEDLNKAFSEYGQVSNCRIITDRESGRSRGFGFVEVEEGDAGNVVEHMNGFVLEGRELVVSEAKPRQPRF